MADRTARPPRRRKPAEVAVDAVVGKSGTDYVIFELASREHPDAWAAAVEEGRAWIARPERTRGANGEAAIKAANRLPDGSVAAGTFKAVTDSTWTAEANNLISLAETKVVNTFLKPGQANGTSTTE